MKWTGSLELYQLSGAATLQMSAGLPVCLPSLHKYLLSNCCATLDTLFHLSEAFPSLAKCGTVMTLSKKYGEDQMRCHVWKHSVECQPHGTYPISIFPISTHCYINIYWVLSCSRHQFRHWLGTDLAGSLEIYIQWGQQKINEYIINNAIPVIGENHRDKNNDAKQGASKGESVW